MITINLKLTLREALEVEMLFDQLAPHLEASMPDRAALLGRVSAALAVDLTKAGALKTEEGWLYPNAS